MSHKSNEAFEMICRALVEEKTFRKRGSELNELCSLFGVQRVRLENMLYDVFGMSGDEIISTLRTGKLHIAD